MRIVQSFKRTIKNLDHVSIRSYLSTFVYLFTQKRDNKFLAKFSAFIIIFYEKKKNEHFLGILA